MSERDWIPIKGRRPEEGQRVLVVFSAPEEGGAHTRECRIATFYAPPGQESTDVNPRWWFVEGADWHALNCVTHWKPLPNLPDEKAGEERARKRAVSRWENEGGAVPELKPEPKPEIKKAARKRGKR